MYICVCNAVSERQVRACVAAGARTLGDLQFELGVASCCGCCAQMAQEYLPGGARADHDAMSGHTIPIHAMATPNMATPNHGAANGLTPMAAAA